MSLRIACLAAVVAVAAVALQSSTYVNAGSETRTLLDLKPAEQTMVRSEMRKLLISVSEILAALNAKDMKGVEVAARKSGMVMVGQVEVSLKQRLTRGFMMLGKSVHVGFDTIADAARDGADRDNIIGLLAQQTNRCTTCHASYGLK